MSVPGCGAARASAAIVVALLLLLGAPPASAQEASGGADPPSAPAPLVDAALFERLAAIRAEGPNRLGDATPEGVLARLHEIGVGTTLRTHRFVLPMRGPDAPRTGWSMELPEEDEGAVPGEPFVEHTVIEARLGEGPELLLVAGPDGTFALLRVARLLQQLVADGSPAPSVTLRFVWSPGLLPTAAWLDDQPDLRGAPAGGGVLGVLLLAGGGGEALLVEHAAASSPTLLDDVAFAAARETALLLAEAPAAGAGPLPLVAEQPFVGEGWHVLFLERAIPSLVLHLPASASRPAEGRSAAPRELTAEQDAAAQRADELVDLALAATLAVSVGDGAAARAGLLLDVAAAGAARRLERLASAIDERVAGLAPDAGVQGRAAFEGIGAILRARDHETAALGSLAGALSGDGWAATLAARERQLSERAESIRLALVERGQALARAGDPPEEAPHVPFDGRIPRRPPPGPWLPRLLADDEHALGASYARSDGTRLDALRAELVMFVDGLRAVTEIADHMAAEFGPACDLALVQALVEREVAARRIGWR